MRHQVRGTLFEPTLFVYRGDDREKLAGEMARRVHKAGVPIVAGTDSIGSGDLGPWSAPNIHAEMALLVKVGGLTPAEALAAASLNGAKALRRDQEFGTITAGRLANLVILGADPLADIANTKSVRWVVKRGYRRLVDDGEARSWKYSLFQIGIAWKERLASYTQAIPVVLKLYL